MSKIKTELALRLTPQMREEAQRRIAAREQRKAGVVWNPANAGFERSSGGIGEIDLGDISEERETGTLDDIQQKLLDSIKDWTPEQKAQARKELDEKLTNGGNDDAQ